MATPQPLLEALLFAAGRPLTLAELARAADLPAEDVTAQLEELAAQLKGRGIRLVRTATAAELVTAPELGATVTAFLEEDASTALSRPALETLAIIIDRQPVTKATIDEQRGIASDQTLKNLLQRGLIEEVGHSPEAGHPVQYGTTLTLLRHLGIGSLDELKQFEGHDHDAD